MHCKCYTCIHPNQRPKCHQIILHVNPNITTHDNDKLFLQQWEKEEESLWWLFPSRWPPCQAGSPMACSLTEIDRHTAVKEAQG